MPIGFLHIGKTGGTALIAALQKVNQDRKLIFHGHAMTLETIWAKAPNRKVIFGVREPVSRYVSAFNSRLRMGLPRHHTPWTPSEALAFSLFQTPNALAEALSAPDTYEKAAAELAMWGIRHINRPLTVYLGSAETLASVESRIRFIFLQASLDADFGILKRLLGLPVGLALPSDDVSAHRSPEGMSKTLSDKATANLTHWYRDDFAVYEVCRQIHDRLVAAH